MIACGLPPHTYKDTVGGLGRQGWPVRVRRWRHHHWHAPFRLYASRLHRVKPQKAFTLSHTPHPLLTQDLGTGLGDTYVARY